MLLFDAQQMGLSVAVDWDKIGTLRNTAAGYDVRTDPLWILVITAKQGHEGSLSDMLIQMSDGVTYAPDAINALALRPDRKWG